MTYCYISSQIAQYADVEDAEEECPCCGTGLVITQLDRMWSKQCEDCGYYEDNEQDYEV